ncbi:Uncharacterised protein [Yersinia intermedia]|jgi:hypothetical protein|nr:Uncharacterised protein [Yersinia intermedia]
MQLPFELDPQIIHRIIHRQAGWRKQGDDGLC